MTDRAGTGGRRKTDSDLVATLFDADEQCEHIALPVLQLSPERLVLRPLDDRPSPGAPVEIVLMERARKITSLDGDVVAGSEPDQIVIRLKNVDPERHETIRQVSARCRVAPADDPERSFGKEARQRRRTAVMDEESLDRLSREAASTDEKDPPGPPAREVTKAVVIPGPRRSFDSLEQALLAAHIDKATREGPPPEEREPFADAGAVPSLKVAPASIQWSTLDSRAASVLAVIDGERDLDKIIAASPLSRKATLQILRKLLERGIISV